ncbi:MAG: ankyrin repeat domain-containing protein [Desulfomonile tiedjei]|nr:ankyrin repeat domain-containing protein [Desulfomonile tiedjei]
MLNQRVLRNQGLKGFYKIRLVRVAWKLAVAVALSHLLLLQVVAAETAKAEPKAPVKFKEANLALGGGNLYALMVGVSKYKDPKIPKLLLADKDTKAFGEFLETQNKVFKETKVTYLINEKATKSEIEKYLYYTLPKAGKDDTVILYFSGHGARDPMSSTDFLFLSHDSEPDFLGTTAVKMSGLDFLKRISAERVLIIADACHSGGFSEMKPKGLAPVELFVQEVKKSTGKVVIHSTKDEQLSWEVPNLKNSVFTHYLIEGLKGNADKDRDGVVTLSEAYEYLDAHTREATKGHQHPQWEGKVSGAFPLSFVGSAVPISELRKGLLDMAKAGNASKVEQTLNTGADVDSRDEENDTPLIVASRFGHDQTVRILLGKGADVGATNNSRADSVSAAAQGGYVKVLRLLVDAGAAVDTRNADGLTPLALASLGGHLDAVKLLLDEGADVKARGNAGETALILAASKGRTKVVKALLKWGAEVNATDLHSGTALSYAALNGYTDIVSLLLAKNAKIKMKRGGYLEHDVVVSALRGDIERLKELLALGGQTNFETQSGESALIFACGLGHDKVVRLLLSRGSGANFVGPNGTTALMLAAASGNTEILRLLLEAGAYVEAGDKNGATALVLAARNGHAEAVRLLSSQTDTRQINDNRGEALIAAAGNGYTEVVKALLATKANVNAKDKQGNTSLICASRNGHKDVVKLLLEKAADTNAKNSQQANALMLAARNGHKGIVKQLLAAGADSAAEDWEGKTALMIASEKGLTDIAEMLKR